MTTGKVFSDSSDIYQDQARILFDYYKNAAEKIIGEEVAVENEQKDLEARKTSEIEKQAKCKNRYIIGFVAAGIGLVGELFMPALFVLALAAVIFAVKNLMDYKKAIRSAEECDTLLNEASEKYKQIRRDYSIEKIGVAYVPVAAKVPYEGKSFLIDQTGSVADTKFHLNVLHQPDELSESIQNLQDSMKSMPVVEENEEAEEVSTSNYSYSMQDVILHDYVGNIDRQVRNISYLLGDSEAVSVDLPAIKPDSREAIAIENYATDNPGSAPVVDVFGNEYESKIDRFASLNSHKNQLVSSEGDRSTEMMSRLMEQLAESVQTLTKEKNASASKLINYTSSIFANVLKSGFTQYSPELEADEIERIRNTEFDYQESVNEYTPFNLKKSSVVKLDIFSNNWVAEDGSRTSMPFGMHQIDEEVLAPVISSLMEENRIERLRIYNNIEDQKREYLEKWSSEVGEYYRDNRKSADELITHMREAYADYMSAYNMYKSLQNTTESMNVNHSVSDSDVKAIDSEAEMLAGFEIQSKQCNEQQEQFADFMDRIQDNINDYTKEFAHIEYYEGTLRDTLAHQTAVAMSNVHNLDPRRKQLVSVGPFIAANADLQPMPKTTDELMNAVDIDLEQQAQDRIEELEKQKKTTVTAAAADDDSEDEDLYGGY